MRTFWKGWTAHYIWAHEPNTWQTSKADQLKCCNRVSCTGYRSTQGENIYARKFPTCSTGCGKSFAMTASPNFEPAPTLEPLTDVAPWCLIRDTQRYIRRVIIMVICNARDTEQGKYVHRRFVASCMGKIVPSSKYSYMPARSILQTDSYMSALTNCVADRQLHVSFTHWQLHVSFAKLRCRPTVTCQLLQICANRQLHASLHKCVQTASYMSLLHRDFVDLFDRS